MFHHISSELSRAFFLKYLTLCSVYRRCHIGVPQGTILGPLLWNAFVYDLQSAIGHMKYADDTTIYNVVKKSYVTVTDSTARKATLIFSVNPLQLSADYAADWCHTNYMLLKTNKSMKCTFTLQKTLSSTNTDK